MSSPTRPSRHGVWTACLAAAILAGACTSIEVPAGSPEATTAPAIDSRPSNPPASKSTSTPEEPTSQAAGLQTAGFIEPFTGNTGLNRFDTGIFHREQPDGGTVSADHDLNCGSPTTQRTVHALNPDESFYMCKDHMMTAIGEWAGYSTGWFTPKQTFSGQNRVAWDVNVTDLGARQWWEVMIVDANFNSGFPDCPQCAVTGFLTPDPSHLPPYPNGSIVVGNGVFGNDVNIWHNGNRYTGWQHTCTDGEYSLFDATSCSTKPPRLPFSITDNNNGTITVNYGGVYTETFSGSFPDHYTVVFKDHNYTPDKDGTPIGHSWHWDNIAIT